MKRFGHPACLLGKHNFIDMTWKDSPFRYCLRCSKVKLQHSVKETAYNKGRIVMREERQPEILKK